MTTSLHCDPDLRRLMSMSSNIIAWANDVFSDRKERRVDDPHNLVLLLIHHAGLSEGSAESQVISLHDQEMRRFLELEAQLRQTPLADRDTFIDLMRVWMRANVDWALASSRYELRGSAVNSLPGV